MTKNVEDFAALIGSRICHDLISPIGAISNGMELLSLAQTDSIPEMALVNESVTAANARIRFFRIAFGTTSDTQTISSREIFDVLEALGAQGRVQYQWHATGDFPRSQAKLALLLIMGLTRSLPFGGKVAANIEDECLYLSACGGEIRYDHALWGLVTGADGTATLAPDTVHFALAGNELKRQGRRLSVSEEHDRIRLSVTA